LLGLRDGEALGRIRSAQEAWRLRYDVRRATATAARCGAGRSAMTVRILHILLVEDSRSDAHLIRALLRKSKLQPFDLECAGDLASALRRLKAGEFDAVLLDLSLPDSEGIETFTKAHAEAPEVPIVILTGLDDEETAVRAVGAGAQDYLVKGQVQGPLLVRALRYAVERKRAADEIRRLNAALERQVRERTAEFEAANR
jgi:DNA-binding response OmpR family regulator